MYVPLTIRVYLDCTHQSQYQREGWVGRIELSIDREEQWTGYDRGYSTSYISVFILFNVYCPARQTSFEKKWDKKDITKCHTHTVHTSYDKPRISHFKYSR